MVFVYSIFSIVLICCYLVVINTYIYHWKRMEVWSVPKDFEPLTSISVVVAARNESENISGCLKALTGLDYPKDLLEIFIVNDHSEDDTAFIVQSFSENDSEILLLNLPEGLEGKKNAINYAVNKASGKLIVSTDADCIVNKDWLLYLSSFYQHYNYKFIAAPVAFHQEKTFFEKFQSLDFMGMMAVSAAGIRGGFMNMCNGANLAYERAAFFDVNGFEGNTHLASGDDMLLMQKIADRFPGKTGYLKNINSQTLTYAQPSISRFIQQRLRWTSKTGAYTGWQVKAMLATVWILCLSMCFDILFMFWYPDLIFLFIFKFLIKALADFFFLGMMSRFFKRQELMRAFILAIFMHWWYIVWVGTVGNFSKGFFWKGRRTV
jgi:cellulose synthase/poly-beta-1,6-N-acetylglucosamine synthase-like glycosyltransferase